LRRLIGIVLAGVSWTACSLTLPEDLARVRNEAACLEWTLPQAIRAGRDADRRTPPETLECILLTLRQEWLQTVDQASVASRVCSYLADVEKDADRRHLLAAEGVRWAEIAESLGAVSDAAVLYYHAVNLGLAVRDNPVLALKNLSRIEALLTRAARIDPRVDQGGPVRVLGMLYLKAPAWPQGIGDPDRALGLLRYAVRHFPGHPQNHLFLAQVLWEVEQESAIPRMTALLGQVARLTSDGRFGVAGRTWNQEAQDLAREAGIPWDQVIRVRAETPPGPGG